MSNPANALLDDVAIKQFVWKSETMKLVAHRILDRALSVPDTFWPDEVQLDDVPKESKNCIGSVFRVLRNMGLIENTGNHRSSIADDAHGRIVWEYRVCHTELCRSLYERSRPIEPQTYSQPDLIA